jgi:hypothetical protein
MRVMFVCLPATGHLLPLLPLAGALRDAGHTVAFATAAGFAPQVERAGFPAIAAGMETEEWDALSGTAFGEALPEWDSNERIAAFGARVFAGGIAQRLIEDLPSAFTAWSADLVVHEDTALGGALAAELVGLKHVRIMILAAGPAHPLYSRIDEAISLLRDRNGLKPDTADATLHRYLLLHPFPPSLLLPDRPVPATYRSARPVLPPPSDDVAPEWLEGLGREPYVSLATVLPRCDLVLSHGGSGTVVAALALGLPQVVVPIFADQPENAARVAALGAGQVISPRERTPEAIRTAILTVLAEPTYRQSAERIRNEISALPQLEETVTLLEQLTAAGVAVNTTST